MRARCTMVLPTRLGRHRWAFRTRLRPMPQRTTRPARRTQPLVTATPGTIRDAVRARDRAVMRRPSPSSGRAFPSSHPPSGRRPGLPLGAPRTYRRSPNTADRLRSVLQHLTSADRQHARVTTRDAPRRTFVCRGMHHPDARTQCVPSFVLCARRRVRSSSHCCSLPM